jgi:hypothetical protein
MKTVRNVVWLLIALTALPVPPSYSTLSLQPLAEKNDPSLYMIQRWRGNGNTPTATITAS